MRLQFTSLFLFTVLAFSTFIFAQQKNIISGFVEYDNITYFKRPDAQKFNARNQGIFQLELNHSISSFTNIFSSIEFREDQANPSRNRIYLDEAYINLYLGDFDLRIGKQIYAWGKADGFNPTDNLTAWDYTDILDTEDEKIGQISLRADYYIGNWSLEGVVVPSFTPSSLPGTNSRWYPKLPSKILNPAYPAMGNAILDVSYLSTSPSLPDEGLNSTQYALKLSGTFAGWDISLSWFDGFDDLPSIRTDHLIDSSFTNANISIKEEYKRRRALGADFATTLGKFGLRGEAAYYITEDWNGFDPAIDDPYLQYVIGLDYTFNDLLAGKDIFILLQWVQELQVPNRHTVYNITDLNHIFRKSILGKLDFNFDEYTKITIKGAGNIITEDWWIQPGFEWIISDGIELHSLVDLLGGPKETFFGMFKDNKRFQFKLKYSF